MRTEKPHVWERSKVIRGIQVRQCAWKPGHPIVRRTRPPGLWPWLQRLGPAQARFFPAAERAKGAIGTHHRCHSFLVSQSPEAYNRSQQDGFVQLGLIQRKSCSFPFNFRSPAGSILNRWATPCAIFSGSSVNKLAL